MCDETAGQATFELPSEVLGSSLRPLPAFGQIGGVEVVIVAKADWLELVMLRGKQTLDRARKEAKTASRIVPSGLSTVEKDAEVADFLRERFRGRMTIETLHVACVETFGRERAPSRNRIQTFRARWRMAR